MMKMGLKMKTRSYTYNINRPKPRHRHKYTKNKMCHSAMMVICISCKKSNVCIKSLHSVIEIYPTFQK